VLELLRAAAHPPADARAMPNATTAPGDGPGTPAPARRPEPAALSIAVLPFASSSGTVDDAAFGAGLTEALIGALSKMPQLTVAARSSTNALRRQRLSIRTIGDTLGVATVLEGGVRREGNRLKVTIDLVATRDSRILWSDTQDVSSQEMFAVQEQIARDVVSALSPRLAGKPLPDRLVDPGTANLEAYRLYLKGRFLYSTRQRDGMLTALQHFNRAVELDPEYARAYAGIADVYNLLAILGYARPRDAFPKARTAAERAVALDGGLVEAHAALAHQLFVYEWDWNAAGPAFERAVALDERYAPVRMYYASFLHSIARSDAALDQLAIARAVDPITPTGLLTGRIHVDRGEPDAAIRMLSEEVELDPRRDLAHQLLAHAYLQKGMYAEAIASMERAAALSGARDRAQLAYIHAMAGDDMRARQILSELLATEREPELLGFHFGMAYAGLGALDEVFRWLEAAFDQRGSFMSLLAVSAGFDRVRGDARFDRMLQRMGLAFAKRVGRSGAGLA